VTPPKHNGTEISLDRMKQHAVQHPGLVLSAMGGGIGGGAYVVGVMKALKKFGAFPHLSKVYMSSAATPAIVYPLLGKDRVVEHVWSEEVTKKEVVDPLRFFGKDPILNIDYLVHDILEKHPLDENAFHTHQTDLFISVTEVTSSTLEHTFLTNKDPYTPLQIIKAAIAIPLLYLLDGRTIPLGGRRYMDGGLLKQILLPETVDIVIATDHQGKKHYPDYGERALLYWYYAQGRVETRVAESIKKRHAVAVEEFTQLYEQKKQQPELIIIRPDHRLPAHVISTKPKDVLRTIQQGERDTQKLYGAIERLLLERLLGQ
jgi:predicted patatin/cPLA2 family phospholipase